MGFFLWSCCWGLAGFFCLGLFGFPKALIFDNVVMVFSVASFVDEGLIGVGRL